MKFLLALLQEEIPLNRFLHNEKGVALVVTLAIVAILIAVALQLGKFTGDAVMTTLIEKDRFQAEQLAISGINLASMILVDDAAKNSVDSVQEPWAEPNMLEQAINEMGLEKETLSIKITDELSKIQANALVSEFPGNQLNPDQNRIWENLFRQRHLNDVALILNSAKDWLDSMDDDTISGISGAESDYYQGLYPAYVCANGPFNHIDEMLSVKGISKDLLKNEEEDKIIDKTEELDLDDIFTVYGQDRERTETGGYKFSGRININTAGVDVLAALLPEGMEDLAHDLVDFREQKSEQGNIFINPLDRGWYKKVIDLSEMEQERFDRSIRYSSDIFRVDCTAHINDAHVILVAVLKREKHKESGKWMCRIIQMERK